MVVVEYIELLNLGGIVRIDYENKFELGSNSEAIIFSKRSKNTFLWYCFQR